MTALEDIPLLRPHRDGPIDGAAAVDAAARAAAAALDGAARVTVVVNDPQRATQTPVVLRRVWPVPGSVRLRALVAAGTHGCGRAEKRRFESQTLRGLPFEDVAWHDCRSGDLADAGGRCSWRCHPWLLADDWALLAIGSCEPHYFAGITGAHKTVTVGCAAFADIEANHAAALSPRARPCRLAGNPVHEGIAAMVAALSDRRAVQAVDLLQVGERIVSASAGGPLEALGALAEQVAEIYTVSLPAPADALVLSAEGVLARSFYQADKAIKNNEWAVRDGGCLVLDAPCPEGVGQDQFLRLLQRCPTYEAADAEVAERGYRLGDHKALKLRYLTDRRGVRVFVVSQGLSGPDARLLGFTKVTSVRAALARAGMDASRHAVYRVADAAHTCVTVAGFDNPPGEQ